MVPATVNRGLTGKKEAGLEWVGFHALRHFRATQWLTNGVDVNIVKELLGHSDIHTTMRYVHYVRTHATKAVRLAQESEVVEWAQAKNGRRIQSGYTSYPRIRRSEFVIICCSQIRQSCQCSGHRLKEICAVYVDELAFEESSPAVSRGRRIAHS